MEEIQMRSSRRGSGGTPIDRGLVLSILAGLMLVFSYTTLTAPDAEAEPGIDFIQIRSAQGGGGEIIGDMTYYVGDTDTYWATGYNFTSGYVGDVIAHWYAYNSSVGWIEPAEGTNTTFHAAGEGETRVWVYYYAPSPNGTNGISNETGVLTVLYRGIDYLQIRDGPHGGGEIVTDRTYFVDDVDSYYAAGYNFSSGYLGDLSVTWETTNDTVCKVTKEGLRADVKALSPGVCRIGANLNATLTNMTGNITVKDRTIITVDDDPGADYFTIHEAVENSSDGYIIYVYNGTYFENLLVDKQLTIKGESRDNVSISGGGSGTVFHVTADNVKLTRLTVKNAEYGIYLDNCNSTTITYNKITSYTYGLYSNRTHDAFVAWNVITDGKYGVVTDHAHNDAVRWNEISYNSEYGAKDYDSQLKNCFNWNYFHHNHIAYYYDPDESLNPLTFDGNRIENNDIGIKAAFASSLIATNNTIENNGVGIELIDSSPYIGRNTLRSNQIGLMFSNSSADVYANYIEGGDYGIVGSGTTPTFQENTIIGAAISEIMIVQGSGGRLIRNILGGGVVRLVDSSVRDMILVQTETYQVNSTVLDYSLDSQSQISVQWYLSVSVKDAAGSPVDGAVVRVLRIGGQEVGSAMTGPDGRTATFVLTEKVRKQNGDVYSADYNVEATKGDEKSTKPVIMDSNKQLGIALGPIPAAGGVDWIFVGAVGFAGVLTVAGLFSIELFVYFFFALFIPLYTKLRKDQVLDHYARGRVYQFIELNPGEHFNAIRRALDLNIGTATYHLEVLHRSGLITSRLDGIYKRFYPTNVPIPPTNGNGVSEVQQRVLAVIKDTPGITQKELARLFGIRQSTLNYQVTKLGEKGLINVEKRGRNVHYFAKQAPPPPP